LIGANCDQALKQVPGGWKTTSAKENKKYWRSIEHRKRFLVFLQDRVTCRDAFSTVRFRAKRKIPLSKVFRFFVDYGALLAHQFVE
jgi:hypothetical protein